MAMPYIRGRVIIICLLFIVSILMIAGKGTCISKRETIDTGSSGFVLVSPANGATNVSYRSPTFTWTDYDSERNYVIQISNAVSDTNATFLTPVYVNEGIGTNITSFTLPQGRLQRGTSYWWRIIAVDLHTTAPITATNAPWSFTTASIMSQPEAFDLVSPANGEIVYGTTPILSWTTPETAESFNLEIDNNNSFTSTPLIYTTSITPEGASWVSGSTRSFTVPSAAGLEVYKTYYWRVTAINGMGQTVATGAPWSFYVKGPLPGDFTLVTPTYSSIQYTLTPTFYWGHSSDATSYTMEIAITDTFDSSVPVITRTINPAGTSVSYTSYTYASSTSDAFNIEIRQIYYWRVFANNNSKTYLPDRSGVLGAIAVAGTTDTKSYGVFTTFQPGDAPDSFTLITPTTGATDVIQTQVFQWTYSTGTLTYTLQINAVNTDFSAPEYEDRNIPSDMIDTERRPITIGILMAGTTYYWRVIAVNPSGQVTAATAPWSFTIRSWAEDTPTTIDQIFPGRTRHTAIWTGTEMVIWGGRDATDYFSSGWRYDTANNEWIDISMTNAPVSRADHTAIWDAARGNMIIWGGYNGTSSLNSGGILNINLNLWAPMTSTGAPLSRTDHTAIWISSRNEMIVWGGGLAGVEYFNDGFKYSYTVDWTTSPVSITDTWTEINPNSFNWAGTALPGRIGHTALWGYDDGGADPYAPLPPSGSGTAAGSPGRNDNWEMYIWGGYNGAWFQNDGARYSPVTPTVGSEVGRNGDWKRISTNSPCPSARWKHTAVWSGSQMLIWGGQYGGTYYNTGARFYPGRPPFSWYGASEDVIGSSWTWTGAGTWLYTSVYSSINGWIALSAVNAPTPRGGHTAVMAPSVSNMLIWGGRDASTYLNSGGMYDIFSDAWTPTSNVDAPQGREEHTVLWTGTEMIVWGGNRDTTYYNDGGRFNPTTNTWIPIVSPASAGIPAREKHTAVWSGSEMIMWGGDAGITSTLRAGARYSPTANKWAAVSVANAPNARTQHTSIWVPGVSQVPTNTAVSETMITWGGYSGTAWLNSGAIYNPRNNSWATINSSLNGTPSIRAGHSAVWDTANEQMVIWGGADGVNYLNTGGRYIPASGGSWLASTIIGAPSVRTQHTAVWTGTEMIVWGGFNESTGQVIRLQSGARYNPAPAGDSWTTISITNAPVSRSGQTAVWASGFGMLVWGGESANNVALNSGGIYTTTNNTWANITTPLTITARAFHTAIWTGTEMIVFGGWNGTVYLKDGGRYNPATDTWKLFTIETTAPRAYHTAVWTGGTINQMIIWGGAILGGYTNTGVRIVPLD